MFMHIPQTVFSEGQILNAPILNLKSQHLNAFVYTGSEATYKWMGMVCIPYDKVRE